MTSARTDRPVVLFVLNLALTAILGGCSADRDTSNKSTFRVALVAPGNITDKSWNQAGYEGLQQTGNRLQAAVAFSEKVPQPDQVEAMGDYARRGYDVVIGHGGEFQEAANQIADRYPETMFVVNNGTTARNNISTVSFHYRQMGYVVGYLSGRMSKSGRGGFIGAQKIRFSTELAAGFEEGFRAANPTGQVLVSWTSDWDDVAKGKEAAINQISQGADVIFPTMDNAVVGSLQAAKEQRIWAIGIYYDAQKDWPETVLQSAILDIREAMSDCIGKIKNGERDGKAYEYGVECQDAVHLGTYHPEVPAEVRKEIDALLDRLRSAAPTA